MDRTLTQIFSKGSRTYFYSSIFFPPKVREDVFKLYSFVRVADDFVDTVPQKKKEFYAFKGLYKRSLDGEATGTIVIDSFSELMKRKSFEDSWVNAFLASMEADIHTSVYHTVKKLRKYLYGSAEVVGLMMSKILDLPEDSYDSAMMLGRSMQYVNFIRDVQEDVTLGRNYLPYKEMAENDLYSLNYNHVLENPKGFTAFMHKQLNRYMSWQHESEKGFKYIPKRYLIPIRTASEMYKWTAYMIYRNPLIVYLYKVKPSLARILTQIGYNLFYL